MTPSRNPRLKNHEDLDFRFLNVISLCHEEHKLFCLTSSYWAQSENPRDKYLKMENGLHFTTVPSFTLTDSRAAMHWCWPVHQMQFRVQCLPQGNFDMWTGDQKHRY